jgi:hypothetical protein
MNMIYWILIFVPQTAIGLMGMCQAPVSGKLGKARVMLFCLPLLPVMPFAPVFLVCYDFVQTRERLRNQEKFAKLCRVPNRIQTDLIKSHSEYTAIMQRSRKLSTWQASSSQLSVLMEDVPQLLLMLIMTSTFTSFELLSFLRFLGAIWSCSWQLLFRYLYRRGDIVNLTGKLVIFTRIFLETSSRLFPLHLALTYFNHLGRPKYTIYMFLVIAAIHTGLVFLMNFHKAHKSPQTYGHRLRLTARQMMRSLLVPTPLRDWDELQSSAKTEAQNSLLMPTPQRNLEDTQDSTITEAQNNIRVADFKQYWLNVNCEYQYLAWIHWIINNCILILVLCTPFLSGMHPDEGDAGLAQEDLPSLISSLCLACLPLLFLFTQLWLFKEYNEKYHPWFRLLNLTEDKESFTKEN